MEGRGLTNLLLAVIAGALLFGKDAMVSGIQGLFFIGVAIAIIWALLSLVIWIISEVVTAYRDSKGAKEAALVTFGFSLMAVLFPMAAYIGWLWLSGLERPMDEAMGSWLGTAWKGLVATGIVGILLYGAWNGLQWLRRNWHDWPDYLMLGVRSLGTAIVAPFVFPIREWRFRRSEGSGVIIAILSSVYAGLFGLALWMVLMVATSFTLLGLGIID
ncbi:hypothetical protein [Aminobacter sp. MDW-2]|uniref:hypothetical protein n=1 Tax=Aminobacter sp. MDW-2 TaxID=2666139 RepID=UPI0012B1573B|nr:hypothetical protein [Aminobacter sp. MDW-2]MRX37238.1 hypothetical protein [Aminobacter sp. MDW-2]QNH33248.1 hypothetical protein H5P29_22455 [Aminobacter sp. MDW-2]